MQHSTDTLQRIVDTMYPYWYSGLYMEEEDKMFDPMNILDRSFTVTFLKENGAVRSMTGYLVEPDKYDNVHVSDYCQSLITKNRIPVITTAGWKSFNVSRIISLVVDSKA